MRLTWLASIALAVGSCGGGQAPHTTVTAGCGSDVDPPPPRNAPLPTIRIAGPGELKLEVFNPLSFTVDIVWATRDQLHPFPIDRLRNEAFKLGRALPGTTVLEVPPDLPPGSLYKLRSEPVPGPGGVPLWSLTPQAWRQVRLQLRC